MLGNWSLTLSARLGVLGGIELWSRGGYRRVESLWPIQSCECKCTARLLGFLAELWLCKERLRRERIVDALDWWLTSCSCSSRPPCRCPITNATLYHGCLLLEVLDQCAVFKVVVPSLALTTFDRGSQWWTYLLLVTIRCMAICDILVRKLAQSADGFLLLCILAAELLVLLRCDWLFTDWRTWGL